MSAQTKKKKTSLSIRWGPIRRLWIELIRRFSMRCLGLRISFSMFWFRTPFLLTLRDCTAQFAGVAFRSRSTMLKLLPEKMVWVWWLVTFLVAVGDMGLLGRGFWERSEKEREKREGERNGEREKQDEEDWYYHWRVGIKLSFKD